MFRITRRNDDKHGARQERIAVMSHMCQVVVMVARDGWNYDMYDHRSDATRYKKTDYATRNPSDGKHVRISMNGPLRMTYAEWCELRDKIDEAYSDVTS